MNRLCSRLPVTHRAGHQAGLALPLALSSGQQVDFLLARIGGPYMTLATFDDQAPMWSSPSTSPAWEMHVRSAARSSGS
jgi:hypothetical protein